jgi:hypothetical protein
LPGQNLPIIFPNIEDRQHSGRDGDCDGTRLPRLQLHFLPSDQALGRFVGGGRQTRIDLSNFRAGARTRIFHEEGDADLFAEAIGCDVQLRIGVGRVRQTKSEGELRCS